MRKVLVLIATLLASVAPFAVPAQPVEAGGCSIYMGSTYGRVNCGHGTYRAKLKCKHNYNNWYQYRYGPWVTSGQSYATCSSGWGTQILWSQHYH